jgi:hypothetical protein
MEPVLGGRANVNPLMVMNRTIADELPSESEGGSETPQGSHREDTSNQGTPMVDDDGDPFLIGASHRAKKRRRNRNPNEGVKQMLEVFEQKWENDATEVTRTREEEKEGRGEFFGLIKEGQQIMKNNQEAISSAVDVLRMMAQRM